MPPEILDSTDAADDFIGYLEEIVFHRVLYPHEVDAIETKCAYWWAVAEGGGLVESV